MKVIPPTKPFRWTLNLKGADGEPVDLTTHQVALKLWTPGRVAQDLVHTVVSAAEGTVRVEFDVVERGVYAVAGIVTDPEGGTAPTDAVRLTATDPSFAAAG